MGLIYRVYLVAKRESNWLIFPIPPCPKILITELLARGCPKIIFARLNINIGLF